MATGLLLRILATMTEFGWLAPGQTVVDPFGGRGSTAAVWCAMDPANRAATVEIEPHFVAMQQSVKAAAERKLGRALGWTILQGDSRKADALLAEAGAAVTSPPYGYRAEPGRHHSEEREMALPPGARMSMALRGAGNSGYGRSDGQIGVLPDPEAVAVTSPPYGEGVIASTKGDPDALIARSPSLKGRNPNGSWFKALASGYVNSEGNIDNLPDEPVGVMSPPYGGATVNSSGIDATKIASRFSPTTQALAMADYGRTPGQIENLPKGDAVGVMSPPYEASLASDDPDKRGGLFRDPKRRSDRTLTAGYSAVTSPPYEAGRAEPNYSEERLQKAAGPCADRLKAHSGRVGGYSVTVTSPPFEAQSGGDAISETGPLADPRLKGRHAASRIGKNGGYSAVTSPPYGNDNTGGPLWQDGGECRREVYGEESGQIGNQQGETYSSACLDVYSALARAGVRYLALVTKNPTRNGKLRRLDKLTVRLLRQAGYRVVGWRRAWLFLDQRQVEALTGQSRLPMDTPESTRVQGRLSFFRRLHMKRGGVAAAYEDVFFAELIG